MVAVEPNRVIRVTKTEQAALGRTLVFIACNQKQVSFDFAQGRLSAAAPHRNNIVILYFC
jgi:hypothetical protein